MNTTRTLRRTAVGALLSGAVAMAGFGLAAGTAQADNQGPYRWCPGQSMSAPAGPGLTVVWNMNVCHTWYRVDYGKGNVANNYGGPPGSPNIWDGDNPPAARPSPCLTPTREGCFPFP
jgi:hypothetical protein